MKTFKQVDVALQLALFITLPIISLLDDDFIFFAYCIMGGWQVASALIHCFLDGYLQSAHRKFYLPAVFLIFVTGLLLWGSEGILIFAYFLLVFSPIIALTYFLMCIKENRMLRHRALIQLK